MLFNIDGVQKPFKNSNSTRELHFFLTKKYGGIMKRKLGINRYMCRACKFVCNTISGLKRHKLACKNPQRRTTPTLLGHSDDGVEDSAPVETGEK